MSLLLRCVLLCRRWLQHWMDCAAPWVMTHSLKTQHHLTHVDAGPVNSACFEVVVN